MVVNAPIMYRLERIISVFLYSEQMMSSWKAKIRNGFGRKDGSRIKTPGFDKAFIERFRDDDRKEKISLYLYRTRFHFAGTLVGGNDHTGGGHYVFRKGKG